MELVIAIFLGVGAMTAVLVFGGAFLVVMSVRKSEDFR